MFIPSSLASCVVSFHSANDSLHTTFNRALPKKAMRLLWDDNGYLLWADKFGSVYRLHISISVRDDGEPEITAQDAGQPIRSGAEHPPLHPPDMLFGHFSGITDITLLHAGNQYIVSADRDEKVRVSHYPNAYNIESYCLAHTAYAFI